MKNKETLFSKNNYDIQLEEVLDEKDFDDEAKSLILSALYRIEESYKDYAKVKLNAKPKSEIIENIINILREKCNKIEILNPKVSKNKLKIDRKNKVIEVFPNEVNLLQSLYYINTANPKKIKNIFDKAIINVINKGEAINNVEIIRDFNGWSWNNVIDTKLGKYYNLIYQNLLLLLGNKIPESNTSCKEIRADLQNKMSEIYGEKNTSAFLDVFEKCCILVYVNNNDKNKNEVLKYLEEKKNELIQMANKSEYIAKITVENNKNMKIVGKIENILQSEALILKNFSKERIRQKYDTVEKYKDSLKKIMRLKKEKINRDSNLINPFEYVRRKKEIEKEVRSLNDIMILLKNENSIYKALITLQRKVITCLYKKIEVFDLKRELVNLIYEVRYYNLLPIEKDKKIKDLKELEVDLRNIQKKLTNKLCENKVVDTFAKDYNINYNIIKYIFITKMTNINKIQLSMIYDNKKLNISYYDENVLEKEEKINFSEDDFNELTKKTNKKMRIII
ncbi:unknown [Clostridium sp. CAG:492]|nr:unknown [Clostridium sp. CAG:492]